MDTIHSKSVIEYTKGMLLYLLLLQEFIDLVQDRSMFPI